MGLNFTGSKFHNWLKFNNYYVNLSFLSLEGLGNLTFDNPLNFNTSISLEGLPIFSLPKMKE